MIFYFLDIYYSIVKLYLFFVANSVTPVQIKP